MAAGYESEITRFIRDLKQRNPDLERGQRDARATWWDRDLDPEVYKRFEQSRLPYPAYVYQPRTKA